MKKGGSVSVSRKSHVKKRPKVHAKSKSSKNKGSKNYKKMNCGQG
jgi:hypothetical protein